jgi:hypothetical protein
MGKNGIQSWDVTLVGLRPCMLDRYAGSKGTQLSAAQKLYFASDGSRRLVLPNINLVSLLSALHTDSAPKRLLDAKKYKRVALAVRSFVEIAPEEIPFLRDGQPITFDHFVEGSDGVERDPRSGVYIHYSVARLKDGIPNEKVRPVIPLPWELQFRLTLYQNPDCTEQDLYNLLVGAGVAIGIGTFRGVFGKFHLPMPGSWREVA